MAPKRNNLRTPQKAQRMKAIKEPSSALGEAKAAHQKSERITPIKQKKVRNLDQEVQKCLSGNFKKFSSKQTDQLTWKDPES